MRVFELARELDMTSKDLISDLEEIGIAVKNHMSALSDDQLDLARREFSGLVPAEPAPESAPEPEPEPEPETAPETPTTESAAEPPAASVPGTETPVEEPAAPAVEPEALEPETPGSIVMKQQIAVKEFAQKLNVKPNILIAELMRMNIFASITETIDFKVAKSLGERHGVRVEREKKAPPPKPEAPSAPVRDKEKKKPVVEERPDELAVRPPVVTFMGHVDHGKTSLLDFIRKSKVVQGESGGITQHIGAYMVENNDRLITFIDTPGHAAFTEMRARGANLTDIVVVVIAAEEGIKPQTREAIQHAQAADVALIVAINKVDLPAANVDRVLQQLQQENLAPEQWGGQTICCPVSASTGQGVDHLLEMILLQSEVMELKANPHRKAEGYVIEARLEPGMGPTASLLVKNGTLKVGDAVVCGDAWGRIKALINDRGVKIRTAGPGYAIQCLGLTRVPDAGAAFEVMENDRAARSLSEERVDKRRMENLQAPKRGLTLDDLLESTEVDEVRELPIIIKADVQGTLEAIQKSLLEIKSDKVELRIVLAGVGGITGNDVLLAKASNAIVIGFHTALDDEASRTARREGIETRLYSIIYELVDDVRNAMAGLLEPITKESPLGKAEVKQVFQLSRRGTVAGCLVLSGRATSKARARVKRDGEPVYEGAISSLKRFQNDAVEVREGQECGLRVDAYGGYQEGDLIEFFDVQKVAQVL